MASTLRRVINASGVIIHTNLGRAPIDARSLDASRRNRDALFESRIRFSMPASGRARSASGTDLPDALRLRSAVLTNNNAAATLLLLAAVAPKREVLVSRGELVEIGGSFPFPMSFSKAA